MLVEFDCLSLTLIEPRADLQERRSLVKVVEDTVLQEQRDFGLCHRELGRHGRTPPQTPVPLAHDTSLASEVFLNVRAIAEHDLKQGEAEPQRVASSTKNSRESQLRERGSMVNKFDK